MHKGREALKVLSPTFGTYNPTTSTSISSMYAMLNKFFTFGGLAIVAVHVFGSLEEIRRDLHQNTIALQHAIAMQQVTLNTCSPEALKQGIDENARLRQELGDLQGALQAAKCDSLKGGAPYLLDALIQSQRGQYHPYVCIR